MVRLDIAARDLAGRHQPRYGNRSENVAMDGYGKDLRRMQVNEMRDAASVIPTFQVHLRPQCAPQPRMLGRSSL